MTRKALVGYLLLAGVAAIASYSLIGHQSHNALLTTKIEQIVPVRQQVVVSCEELAAMRPLVLLALGQSNAGNHGSLPERAPEAVTLIAEGKCIKATDPLPGGTGTGGSIWQRLPAMLSTQNISRPVLLSVLAVDATSIEDWTSPGSPLVKRLLEHLGSMQRLGLTPDFVLWQQGEADALSGVSSADYSTGLDRLAAILNGGGSTVPIILARSTICRSDPHVAIRNAIQAKVSSDPGFRLGPDTDVLSASTFRDGCHMTTDGLNSAAKMWATVILVETLAIKDAH